MKEGDNSMRIVMGVENKRWGADGWAEMFQDE
jgi:hypothetical protein